MPEKLHFRDTFDEFEFQFNNLPFDVPVTVDLIDPVTRSIISQIRIYTGEYDTRKGCLINGVLGRLYEMGLLKKQNEKNFRYWTFYWSTEDHPVNSRLCTLSQAQELAGKMLSEKFGHNLSLPNTSSINK